MSATTTHDPLAETVSLVTVITPETHVSVCIGCGALMELGRRLYCPRCLYKQDPATTLPLPRCRRCGEELFFNGFANRDDDPDRHFCEDCRGHVLKHLRARPTLVGRPEAQRAHGLRVRRRRWATARGLQAKINDLKRERERLKTISKAVRHTMRTYTYVWEDDHDACVVAGSVAFDSPESVLHFFEFDFPPGLLDALQIRPHEQAELRANARQYGWAGYTRNDITAINDRIRHWQSRLAALTEAAP